MKIALVILLITIVDFLEPRVFDVCPGRRQSIGACLVGLCPAGSECINSYCCKFKKNTTSTIDIVEVDVDEISAYGTCSNGARSIGECISGACPLGYTCDNSVCCEVVDRRGTKIKKEEEIAMKSSPITLVTTPPEDSQENIVSEETDSTVDSQSLENKTTSRPKKVEKSNEDDDEDEETNEEVDEEESETTTTTTTEPSTTTKPPTTIKNKSRKSKKPKSQKSKTTSSSRTSTTTTTTTTTEIPLEVTTHSSVTSEEEETAEPKFVCPVGAPIGECISGKCPEGHACVEGQCCILTPQINCTDALAGCLPHLCDRKGYKQFMTKNCAKTCARCHLVNITTTDIRDCRDRRSDCAEWAAEGFCESSLYSTRQKLKFCGKSCKLC